MKTFIHKIIAIFTLISLIGCTTMQELKHQEDPLTYDIKTGEHIIVYEKSGRIVDMRFVHIDGDVMRGSLLDDGLEPVEIKLSEIEKIEAERIEAGRTAAAVVGGIVVLPIVALGAGIALTAQ